jgi:Ca2+-transporting ATPase
VAIQAGDVVPADGRLLTAATLEVDESALTGESLPVAKGTEPVPGADTPLGDRSGMVYMNTDVTRGADDLVVTATGMATQVGQISGTLTEEQAVKPPLTRQLDRLTGQILVIAGLALIASMALNLVRGETFIAVFNAAVAFAIAAIPVGLPTVVTTILALGDGTARHGWRDHEAAGLDPDARVYLGDQLGQDRHADAEPDDRGPDDGRWPPVRD